MGSKTAFHLGRLWFLIAILALEGDAAQACSVGLNLFGVSYHHPRRDPRGNKINEFNPGFGLRTSFDVGSKHTLFVEGASFLDSFECQATYLALGYQFRIWKQLRTGLIAGVYQTESTQDGDPFPGAAPVVSYKLPLVTINLAYLAEYGSISAYRSFAAYLTINLLREPKPHLN